MKKILIVSKIIIGSEPTLYGFNDEDRLFRKSFSKKLSKNLKEKLKKENIDYEVDINADYHRDIKIFIEEYDLLLLSPYIVDRINFDHLTDESYYILSIDEFEKGKTNQILMFLNNL